MTHEWKLSSFEMGRPLGKGKFGRVYMVRTRTQPAFILALKTIYKSEVIASNLEAQTRREIEIQSNLRWLPPIMEVNILSSSTGIPMCSDSMATFMTRSDCFLCWSTPGKASYTDSWQREANSEKSDLVGYAYKLPPTARSQQLL